MDDFRFVVLYHTKIGHWIEHHKQQNKNEIVFLQLPKIKTCSWCQHFFVFDLGIFVVSLWAI